MIMMQLGMIFFVYDIYIAILHACDFQSALQNAW